MHALLFLVDDGEQYEGHELQISSELGEGLRLTLQDVQAIAKVQGCGLFAAVPLDAVQWMEGHGPTPASEWIALGEIVRTHWPSDADEPTYWLEPEVAEWPPELIAKVVRAGASATSLRDGQLQALRRHLDDVQAGRAPTVPIHVPYCDATRDRPGGDQLECDCGYEWPRGKG